MEATVLPEMFDNNDTVYQQSAETLDNIAIEIKSNSTVAVFVCCIAIIAVVFTVIYCFVRPNSTDENKLFSAFEMSEHIQKLQGCPVKKSTVVHFKCPDLDETNSSLKDTGEDHMKLPGNEECFSPLIVEAVKLEA